MPILSQLVAMRLYTGRHGPIAVDVECRYRTSDPFAVELTLPAAGPERTAWVFARDLLTTGLLIAAGDGDVRIEPADGRATLIAFGSVGQGFALLEAPTGELDDFLSRSFAEVPEGTESARIDWIAHIARLLDERPDA